MSSTLTDNLPGSRSSGGVLEIPVSRKQAEFLNADEDHVLFCAGIGSGKTKCGAIWAFREMMLAPGVGFIGANTHQQLMLVTLKAFIDTLDEYQFDYVYNNAPPVHWGKSAFPKHDGILSVRTGSELRQIICAQLGTFNFKRGIEIRWYWIDETRDTKEEAFNVLLGRMRGGPHWARRRGRITTTPNGFNWLYDKFASSGEKRMQGARVIHATSHDNPWLPPGYVESLLRNYSRRFAQQEIEGRFVSLTEGQAFAEFRRELHVTDRFDYQPDLPLIHAWDFNVSPLCSNILQIDRSVTPHVVRAIDEIHIEGSARTRDATEEFIRRYGQHRGKVIVHGDASGGNRSTRGDLTDFKIIAEDYRRAFGAGRVEMRPNYYNPVVADSVQDVNSMLMNAFGQVRLTFHPRCEYLIRDMEQVCFKPGTRVLDKSEEDKGLVHHSDALRYFVSMEFPCVSKAAGGGTPKGF